MRRVIDGAESLAEDEYVPNERLLETGIVVAYCRAFTKGGKGREPITVTMLPENEEELHFRSVLFAFRDTLYAHSDETDALGPSGHPWHS
jgi:hypothetical protein